MSNSIYNLLRAMNVINVHVCIHAAVPVLYLALRVVLQNTEHYILQEIQNGYFDQYSL